MAVRKFTGTGVWWNFDPDNDVIRIPSGWSFDATLKAIGSTEENPLTFVRVRTSAEDGKEGIPLYFMISLSGVFPEDLSESNYHVSGQPFPGVSGDDTLTGSVIDDKMIGGAGDDTLNGDAGDDTLKGGQGDDTLNGGQGDDWLRGYKGGDTLNGDAGDDRLYGNEGDDTLNGGTGDDKMLGGAGDDTLDGGAGDDTLKGGAGDDTLTGGAGDDIFIYGGKGADTITDFADGDTIRLKKIAGISQFSDFTLSPTDGGYTITFAGAGNTLTITTNETLDAADFEIIA